VFDHNNKTPHPSIPVRKLPKSCDTQHPNTCSTKTSQVTQIIVLIFTKSRDTPLCCLLTLGTKTSQVAHIIVPKLPRSRISQCQNFPTQFYHSTKTSQLSFIVVPKLPNSDCLLFLLVFIQKSCKTMQSLANGAKRSGYRSKVQKSAENDK
jgi:hypothetical protein